MTCYYSVLSRVAHSWAITHAHRDFSPPLFIYFYHDQKQRCQQIIPPSPAPFRGDRVAFLGVLVAPHTTGHRRHWGGWHYKGPAHPHCNTVAAREGHNLISPRVSKRSDRWSRSELRVLPVLRVLDKITRAGSRALSGHGVTGTMLQQPGMCQHLVL